LTLTFFSSLLLSLTVKRFPGISWVWLCFLCLGARAASITDLGILPGYSQSGASAISADGKIVVGACSKYENGQNIVEPFIWTAAQGMVSMGWMPDCTNCAAMSVSTNGVVVGQCVFANSTVAFKWTAQNGYTALTHHDPETYATSVSANGQVIVGYAGNQGDYYAAKWNAANEFTPLGPFGSKARDVSGDGSVIVGTISDANYPYILPVLWRAGGQMEYLNTVANPPAGFTLYTANAVTLDGQFIGGYCKTPLHPEAYIWSAEAGLKTLGNIDTDSYQPPKGQIAATPSPIYTEAFAVAEGGRSAVGRNYPGYTSRTFIWTAEHGAETIAQTLDRVGIIDPAWDANSDFTNYTTDISADGEMIVGSMERTQVGLRPFLLDLREMKAGLTQSGVQLTWPEGYKLQQTTGLDFHTWHDVSAAASPFTIPPDGPGSFFRIIHLP
jgi:uncharacterized membrane protein